MSDHITSDQAVKKFSEKLGHGHTLFVAVAYWLDDAWAICAGDDREKVVASADLYLETWPVKFTAEGNFINGHGAEGYWIMEVPVV